MLISSHKDSNVTGNHRTKIANLKSVLVVEAEEAMVSFHLWFLMMRNNFRIRKTMNKSKIFLKVLKIYMKVKHSGLASVTFL